MIIVTWLDFANQNRWLCHLVLETKSLFGSVGFWFISLNFHNWVFKMRGSHKNIYVWLGFQHLFPSLEIKKFEIEGWKQEKTIGCFQKLWTDSQWQQHKYKEFAGLITCVLSNQFRTHVILPSQIWASTFLTSLKIFQPKFSLFLTSLSPSCHTCMMSKTKLHMVLDILESKDLRIKSQLV